MRRIVDNGSLVVAAPVPVTRTSRMLTSSGSTRSGGAQMLPLAPGNFDLSVYRGDTYEWVFVFTGVQFIDGAWTATRLPFDVTNWRVKAEIRAAVDGELMGSLQRIMPTDRGEALAEMRAGTVRMRLTADQSRLVNRAGVWDLEVRTGDGWVKTVLRGAVNYLGDVTTGVAPPLGGG